MLDLPSRLNAKLRIYSADNPSIGRAIYDLEVFGSLLIYSR
jgi:hypothetical protein